MISIIPQSISATSQVFTSTLTERLCKPYCVISSISVNYFDNGQITAYHDGMPKSTSLSLSLKEITVPMRDDFKDKKKK